MAKRSVRITATIGKKRTDQTINLSFPGMLEAQVHDLIRTLFARGEQNDEIHIKVNKSP